MNFDTERRFQAVFAACLIFSLGSVPFAVYYTHKCVDATRGGAVAAALSLVIIFMTRREGSRFFAILTREAPRVRAMMAKIREASEPVSSVATTEDKADALISKAKVDDYIQELQNRYLVWSSAIGTLMWGFGDIIAMHIRPGCT